MVSIVTDYEKLSEHSDEINAKKQNGELKHIIDKLKECMKDNNLLGLSAPQIGYNKRVITVNFNGRYISYINPIIVATKGMQLSKETCPSFPGKIFLRLRASEIDLTSQNPLGKANTQHFVGLAAIIVQELVDHLDGLLLSDVALEITEEFEALSDEDKYSLISEYLQELDRLTAQFNKEVENDEDATQMRDAVEFMKSVRSGKTRIAIETVKV